MGYRLSFFLIIIKWPTKICAFINISFSFPFFFLVQNNLQHASSSASTSSSCDSPTVASRKKENIKLLKRMHFSQSARQAWRQIILWAAAARGQCVSWIRIIGQKRSGDGDDGYNVRKKNVTISWCYSNTRSMWLLLSPWIHLNEIFHFVYR